MTDPIDLLDPALVADPFTFYGRIRDTGRPTRATMPGTDPMWLATSHADAMTVLTDPRFVNDAADVPGIDAPDLTDQLLAALGVAEQYRRFIRPGMNDLSGPAHARLRGKVSRAFTGRRVQGLRPRMVGLATDLLDQLESHAGPDGVVDVLAHFGYPLSITVICELVGIPADRRPRWREWGALLGTGTDPRMGEAVAGLVDDTADLITRRRAEPADDLIGALLAAQRDDPDPLTDRELITMVVSLVMAGHETTAHLIGNGVIALLTHPDQLRAWRDDPGLAPGAVRELLRWCGPVIGTRMRYAAEDVTFGGITVHKGEAVLPVPASANRDPRRFDDPDRLDITRVPGDVRHLAFGHGPHHCLGAALALTEAEVAFGALLDRYPDLRLGVPAERLVRGANPGSWQWAEVPVRLRS